MTDKMRKMKKKVMDPFSAASFGAGSLELRKKYISMVAVEVVLEVFTNAADIFSSKLNKVRSTDLFCRDLRGNGAG